MFADTLTKVKSDSGGGIIPAFSNSRHCADASCGPKSLSDSAFHSGLPPSLSAIKLLIKSLASADGILFCFSDYFFNFINRKFQIISRNKIRYPCSQK